MTKLNNFVTRSLEIAACAMLTVIVVAVFLQVIFRYVLQSPLSWSEEVARYLFVWFSFVGASIAAMRGTHYALSLVVERMPERQQAGVAMMVNGAIAVLMLVVARQTVTLLPVLDKQVSGALGIPMSWPYASILVASLAMASAFGSQAYGYARTAFHRAESARESRGG